MSDVTIRPAEITDADIIAALRRADATERRSVPRDADPDYESRFADWAAAVDDISVAWIAEISGEPVGMLHMFIHDRMPMPAVDTGRWGYVSSLFVLPMHRNKGLGRSLLDVAFDYAAGKGISRILLHATDRAVPLYLRAGFGPPHRYLTKDIRRASKSGPDGQRRPDSSAGGAADR